MQLIAYSIVCWRLQSFHGASKVHKNKRAFQELETTGKDSDMMTSALSGDKGTDQLD